VSGHLSDAEFGRRVRALLLGDEASERERVVSASLYIKVAACMVADPDAPPSVVAARVRGRRQDVLRVRKEILEASTRFPSPGNRVSDAEAGE
jgi:hypothetical protein